MKELLAIGGPLAGHKITMSDRQFDYHCHEYIAAPPQPFGEFPTTAGEVRHHLYRRATFVLDDQKLELMVHATNPPLSVLEELLNGYERRATLRKWMDRRHYSRNQIDAIETGKL